MRYYKWRAFVKSPLDNARATSKIFVSNYKEKKIRI